MVKTRRIYDSDSETKEIDAIPTYLISPKSSERFQIHELEISEPDIALTPKKRGIKNIDSLLEKNPSVVIDSSNSKGSRSRNPQTLKDWPISELSAHKAGLNIKDSAFKDASFYSKFNNPEIHISKNDQMRNRTKSYSQRVRRKTNFFTYTQQASKRTRNSLKSLKRQPGRPPNIKINLSTRNSSSPPQNKKNIQKVEDKTHSDSESFFKNRKNFQKINGNDSINNNFSSDRIKNKNNAAAKFTTPSKLPSDIARISGTVSVDSIKNNSRLDPFAEIFYETDSELILEAAARNNKRSFYEGDTETTSKSSASNRNEDMNGSSHQSENGVSFKKQTNDKLDNNLKSNIDKSTRLSQKSKETVSFRNSRTHRKQAQKGVIQSDCSDSACASEDASIHSPLKTGPTTPRTTRSSSIKEQYTDRVVTRLRSINNKTNPSKYNLRTRSPTQTVKMQKATELISNYEKFQNMIAKKYGKYELKFENLLFQGIKDTSVSLHPSQEGNVANTNNSNRNSNSLHADNNFDPMSPTVNGLPHKRKKRYWNSDSRHMQQLESSSGSDSDDRKSTKMNILPLNYKAILEARKNNSSVEHEDGSSPNTQEENVSQIPSVSFDQVGGLYGHICTVKEVVVLPLLYPEICTRFSLRPPRGLLFHGPPGTGKTLLARALANSCSTQAKPVAFFMVRGSECLSKFIGEGERHLRQIFDAARQLQPSIIFFDEIDGLAPTRNSRHDQSHISIVTTLLVLMDGLEDRGQVIVIGATNRLDSVDPALRRPGRFDRELFFGYPDHKSRKQIIQIHTRKWPSLPSTEMLDLIAEKTSGWGGAEISSLVNEVAMTAVRRHFPSLQNHLSKESVNVSAINVTDDDVLAALDNRQLISSSFSDGLTILSPLLGGIINQVNEIFSFAKKSNNMGLARLMITGNVSMGQEVFRQAIIQNLIELKVNSYILNPGELLGGDQLPPESKIYDAFRNARQRGGVVVVSGLNDWIREEWVITFNQCISELIGSTSVGLLIVGEIPMPKWVERVDSLIGELRFSLGDYTEANVHDFFFPIKELALTPIQPDLDLYIMSDMPECHILGPDGQINCNCTFHSCPCNIITTLTNSANGSSGSNSIDSVVDRNNHRKYLFSKHEFSVLSKLQTVLQAVLEDFMAEPRLNGLVDLSGLYKELETNPFTDNFLSLNDFVKKNKEKGYFCAQQFLHDIVSFSDTIFILGGVKEFERASSKNWYKDSGENEVRLKMLQKALIKIILGAMTVSNTPLLSIFKQPSQRDAFGGIAKNTNQNRNDFDFGSVSLNLLKKLKPLNAEKENFIDSKPRTVAKTPLDIINDTRFKFVDSCRSRGLLGLKYGFAHEDKVKSALMLLDLAKNKIIELVDVDLLVDTRNLALRHSEDLDEHSLDRSKVRRYSNHELENAYGMSGSKKRNSITLSSSLETENCRLVHAQNEELADVRQPNDSCPQPLSQNNRTFIDLRGMGEIDVNGTENFNSNCHNSPSMQKDSDAASFCACKSSPLPRKIVASEIDLAKFFQQVLVPLVIQSSTIESLESLYFRLFNTVSNSRKSYTAELSVSWTDYIIERLTRSIEFLL